MTKTLLIIIGIQPLVWVAVYMGATFYYEKKLKKLQEKMFPPGIMSKTELTKMLKEKEDGLPKRI